MRIEDQTIRDELKVILLDLIKMKRKSHALKHLYTILPRWLRF